MLGSVHFSKTPHPYYIKKMGPAKQKQHLRQDIFRLSFLNGQPHEFHFRLFDPFPLHFLNPFLKRHNFFYILIFFSKIPCLALLGTAVFQWTKYSPHLQLVPGRYNFADIQTSDITDFTILRPRMATYSLKTFRVFLF